MESVTECVGWSIPRFVSVTGGNQEAVGCSAELIALELKQFYGDGIQAGDARGKTGGKKLRDQGCFRAVLGIGQSRNGCADESARRKPAALTGPLVVQEKISPFLVNHRAAKAPAENILLHRGPREALTVQEEFIAVQNDIAKR